MRNAAFLCLLPLLAGLCMNAAAQDVTAFIDYRDRLHVFDRGTFQEVEPLRPGAVGLGGNYVAFTTSIGDLKLYRNGKVVLLDRTIVTDPTITDHLLGFRVATMLKIHDGRELHTLSINTGNAVVEDSLVGWYDNMQHTFNVWYNGVTQVVEDGLANDPVNDWRSGDNLVAWTTNIERKFKIFYHGYIYEGGDVFEEGLDYAAGADVVAYVDPRGMGFKAFYQGEFLDLDPMKPLSYQVGKGIVAWQSVNGSLKVMEGGRIYDAMDFAPSEYFVRDSLVVVHDRDIIKVFQDGRIYEVDRIWPSEWNASWGTLAYRAADSTVRVWRRGVNSVAIREQNVERFILDRGLLQAIMPLNAVKVWWRGQVYTH